MTTEQSMMFASSLGLLCEAFNEPLSDVRLEAYRLALEDIEPSALVTAMGACLRECKFMPRPAEIRERVSGSEADRSEVAWASVLDAVRRIGYTGWPGHLDAATHDAIRAVWGSWRRLCETLPADGPELLGWRKAFAGAYGATERQSARQLSAGHLDRVDQLAPAVRRMLRPGDAA